MIDFVDDIQTPFSNICVRYLIDYLLYHSTQAAQTALRAFQNLNIDLSNTVYKNDVLKTFNDKCDKMETTICTNRSLQGELMKNLANVMEDVTASHDKFRSQMRALLEDCAINLLQIASKPSYYQLRANFFQILIDDEHVEQELSNALSVIKDIKEKLNEYDANEKRNDDIIA
jgi:hypothetical protein